ncbi:MAG: FG-GAP repeat domain-containing protein [Phycisphaerae bacterium]
MHQPNITQAAALAALALAACVRVAGAQCTHGDLDGSGTVDLSDYALLVDCVSGPGQGPAPRGCGPVDADADGDVDVRDFAAFQRVFGATLGARLFPNEQFGTGDEPVSVAIGDLDGDGDLDLAVATSGGFQNPAATVSVLLNHGDGTFAEDVLYGAGDVPWSVAIADLDGDGNLDLAVANTGADNVSVLLSGCIP